MATSTGGDARIDLVCFVTGKEGLSTDAVTVLVDAFERAACVAALATAAPSLRGASAASSGAGRHLALASFDTSSGALTVHHLDVKAPPLDLRAFYLALRALSGADSTGIPPPQQASAPRLPPGSYGALAALAALDDGRWSGAVSVQLLRVTLLCAPPSHHVDSDTLRGLLDSFNRRNTGVSLACIAAPSTGGAGVEEELRASHALHALSAELSDSDNGSFVDIPLSSPGTQRFALSLLFPEARGAGSVGGAGRPSLRATLALPAPLLASAPSSRLLRLTLRPEIVPLHDACEPVRICRCHGRGLLSKETSIGSEDIAHFLTLAAKNDVCCVTANKLSPPEWLTNSFLIGRDTALLMPSFYTPAFAQPQHQRAAERPLFTVLATLPLHSLSESLLFGVPWAARAADGTEPECGEGEDGEDALMMAGGGGGGMVSDEEGEEGGMGGGGGGAMHFAALCGALREADAGLLCWSACNLDSGKATPFRCLYVALPPAGPPSANQPPQLLLKRIAGKEEQLPAPPGAAAEEGSVREVPAAMAAEAARAVAAMPHKASYDPAGCERGLHKVLSALVAKSLAPPQPSSRQGKVKRKGA